MVRLFHRKITLVYKCDNVHDNKYVFIVLRRRIVIYPKGNTKRGIEGHISLYLVIDKTESLPLGWEAYATYKIFLYDHNKDKYLTIQSA